MLSGLCLVDEFGNFVDPIACKRPPPLLKVEWSGERFAISPPESAPQAVPSGPEGEEEWVVAIPIEEGSVSLYAADMKPLWQNGMYTPAISSGMLDAKKVTRSSETGNAAMELCEDRQTSSSTRRGILSCYVIAAPLSFDGRVASLSGVPMKISVVDSVDATYVADVIDSCLVPGLPSKIMVKCAELSETDFKFHINATVTSDRELESIELKLIDRFGNDASVNHVKTSKVNG